MSDTTCPKHGTVLVKPIGAYETSFGSAERVATGGGDGWCKLCRDEERRERSRPNRDAEKPPGWARVAEDIADLLAADSLDVALSRLVLMRPAEAALICLTMESRLRQRWAEPPVHHLLARWATVLARHVASYGDDEGCGDGL